MVRVLVSYPNKPGARFDLDYYLTKHMPMVGTVLAGAGITGWSVDQAVAGGTPGSEAEFRIQAILTFESLDAFKEAMAKYGPEILADVPNYTDIQPMIQVNQTVGQQALSSSAA